MNVLVLVGVFWSVCLLIVIALCRAAADGDQELERRMRSGGGSDDAAPLSDRPTTTSLYIVGSDVGPSTVHPEFDEEWDAQVHVARGDRFTVYRRRDPEGAA
jgi:hypothetical protein